MKKYVLSLMAVVFGIGLSAFNAHTFNSKQNPSLLPKQYVGIAFVDGRFYLEESPTEPGTPYEIPAHWQDGDDYECIECQANSVCTVTANSLATPCFDFNTGCYYLDEEDVIQFDEGLFFLL